MTIITIGIDLAKNIFAVHGVNESRRAELVKSKVSRDQLLPLIANPPPILQVFCARMKTNGLAPKAVVGAAMRKLAHLIYGVVNSGKPFDVDFALNRLAIQDGI